MAEESSKERYARAMAARKAAELEERTRKTEERRVAMEALAASAADHQQTVLAPPDPNRSGGRQLAGILGVMALLTIALSILATLSMGH